MILILGVIAWWISEGSGLIDHLKRFLFIFDIYTKKDLQGNKIQAESLKPLDCAKCLGFWIGIGYYFNSGYECIINAILVSSVSIIISKILWRLR